MEEAKQIYLIDSNETIAKALEVITENHKGSAVVVNGGYKLLGVVSDGDIRRGLVHGSTVYTPINKVMNVNCRYVEEKNLEKAEEILQGNVQINLIPIVDEENCLVDVIVREDK